MGKSPDAFRTISEVAQLLETPAHVLRFWESKFPQVKPVKRAGGRRYYRPDDIALLAGIKALLHDQGLTIRGVQKILREQGVRHVAGLGGPPSGATWEGIVDGLEDASAEGDEEWAADGPPDEAVADGEPAESPLPSFLEAVIARVAAPDGPDGSATPPDEAEPWESVDPADDEEDPAGVVVPWTGTVAPRNGAMPNDAGRTRADGTPTVGRVLDLLGRADPLRLRSRAAEIAPLARRLAALRADDAAHPR